MACWCFAREGIIRGQLSLRDEAPRERQEACQHASRRLGLHPTVAGNPHGHHGFPADRIPAPLSLPGGWKSSPEVVCVSLARIV